MVKSAAKRLALSTLMASRVRSRLTAHTFNSGTRHTPGQPGRLLSVCLRAAGPRAAGHPDRSSPAKRSQFSRGKKVTYTLSPENPFIFSIQGHVVEGGGQVWVDFGDFGKAQFKEKVLEEIRFTAIPFDIGPADSAEWGPSNSVRLTL